MRTVNVDRMRRYRERTSRPSCETCRDFADRASREAPFTIAAMAVRSEALSHYFREHQ